MDRRLRRQANVRKELARGGSFRDIGDRLASRKAHREYKPRIEIAQLPERLQNELAGFAKTVWEAAAQEAARQLDADRRPAEDLIAIDRQLRDEALADVDALEARIEALQAGIGKLRLELVTVREGARADVER